MSYGRIAVFDVDETLITCKSMFSFLAFAFRQRYGPEGEARCRAALEGLQAARLNLPREEVNRAYYRLFAGWRMEDLRASASAWFLSLDRKSLFIPETLSRYETHVEAGDTTVLLTGSAGFIVAPIAQLLGADVVLAIELAVDPDGITSGEIAGIQTIGQGKAQALCAYFCLEKPLETVGYGDHESDLAFLELCDQAFVVTAADRPTPDWAARLNRLDFRRTLPVALPVAS